MALTVDSSPLSLTCNSYVSLAEMAAYVANRVPDPSESDAWLDLDAAVKAAYVTNASRSLDGLVDWIGNRYSSSQQLKWPRYGAVVDGFLLDSTVFPQAVKDATCEMVVWYMENDGVVSVTQNDAYSAIKVGPINIDFNTKLSQSSNKYCPDIISIILKDLGIVHMPAVPGSLQAKTVGLIRV